MAAKKEDFDKEQAALYNLEENRFFGVILNIVNENFGLSRCWKGFSDPISKVGRFCEAILTKSAKYVGDRLGRIYSVVS